MKVCVVRPLLLNLCKMQGGLGLINTSVLFYGNIIDPLLSV